MFNPLSSSASLPEELAKALRFAQQIRRLLSQNLTVLYLIYFIHCIVFKDRVSFEPLFSRQRLIL